MVKKNLQREDPPVMPPVILEKTYDFPVSKVWQALTGKEAIRQWSFDVNDFQPRVGFEFQFYGGKDDRSYLHLCKIEDVVPERKLTYSWRYDGIEGTTRVTWELFPEGNRTRVRLTHEGIEKLANAGTDFGRENFNSGWDHMLTKTLKAYMVQKG